MKYKLLNKLEDVYIYIVLGHKFHILKKLKTFLLVFQDYGSILNSNMVKVVDAECFHSITLTLNVMCRKH